MTCKKVIKVTDIENSIDLTCDKEKLHIVCSVECMKTLVLNCTNNDVREKTICPLCGTHVSEDLIILAFGGLDQYEEKKREKIPSFDCDLCMENIKVDLSVTLDCEHRYCKNCMEIYLKSYIMEGKIDPDELICFKCRNPINYEIIKHHVSEQCLIVLDKFLLRRVKFEESDAIDFRCRGVDCEFREVLPLDLDEYTCQVCNTSCCPKCYSPIHRPKTCEEYKRDNDEDAMINEYALNAGLMKCPHCGIISERYQGCAFMTCQSQQCRSQKYFCYICGCVLQTSEHYTHFFDKPFGIECRNKNNRPAEEPKA